MRMSRVQEGWDPHHPAGHHRPDDHLVARSLTLLGLLGLAFVVVMWIIVLFFAFTGVGDALSGL